MSNSCPSDWPRTSIKRSGYLRGRIGWQGLRASEFLEEGPYLVTGTDFDDGRIDWSRCYHVSESRFAEGAYIHLRDGDLLVTKDGTIGKVAYVTDCPEKAVLNSGIFLLRSSDGSFDHRFLFHLLRSESFEGFLRQNLNGSTINHLYQYVFERFEFPIPDGGIQPGIVDVLDSIDDQIRATESLIAKHQQIKAGLMHDLFTRGVDAQGRLRPPREEAPELYKLSPLGWIPKEWDVSGLRQKAHPMRPYLKTGPFGSSLKGEHWVEEGHPVITIGSLGEGEFIESELLHVSFATAQRLCEFQLRPGDVVFSRVADVGRSVAIRAEHEGWIMSSNFMRISLDQGQVIPEFLQQQLSFDSRLRAQIRASVNSGGRDVANSAIMNTLLFVLPPFPEQERIMAFVGTIDAKRASERWLLEKLRLEKSGLMSDLLSGRVRVPA